MLVRRERIVPALAQIRGERGGLVQHVLRDERAPLLCVLRERGGRSGGAQEGWCCDEAVEEELGGVCKVS